VVRAVRDLVGGLVGVWRLRKHGVSPALFADAMAPGLLLAQGIGRIGNYFNKELFGRPTSLPWGLQIPYQDRVAGGIPTADLHFSTFQPTFLYELIFDFAWAGLLIWIGHRRQIKPPGIFALYVFGYSAYRIFEEWLRVDSSVHIFGLRLNFYIATILAIFGAVWFYRSQHRPARVLVAQPAAGPDSSAEGGPAGAAGDPDGIAAGRAEDSDPDRVDPDSGAPESSAAEQAAPGASPP
jgi:prolipoprotein diacylglyceryltransferase